MNALEVAGLKKNYAGFSLDVSFALEEGKITGFIDRIREGEHSNDLRDVCHREPSGRMG